MVARPPVEGRPDQTGRIKTHPSRTTIPCLTGRSEQEDGLHIAAEGVVKKGAARGNLAPLFTPPVDNTPSVDVPSPVKRSDPQRTRSALGPIAPLCADCAESRQKPCTAWPCRCEKPMPRMDSTENRCTPHNATEPILGVRKRPEPLGGQVYNHGSKSRPKGSGSSRGTSKVAKNSHRPSRPPLAWWAGLPETPAGSRRTARPRRLGAPPEASEHLRMPCRGMGATTMSQPSRVRRRRGLPPFWHRASSSEPVRLVASHVFPAPQRQRRR